MDDIAVCYTTRQPLGVCGLISPWNLPLYLLTWKIAPAIACGNTVVCKPSELTPRTATMLGQVLLDAGLPAGVVNIVHGVRNTLSYAYFVELEQLLTIGVCSWAPNVETRLCRILRLNSSHLQVVQRQRKRLL